MFSGTLPQLSLKTRITISVLAVFVVSIWILALFGSRMLGEELRRQLSVHQFSTASFVAAEINVQLDERLKLLKSVARKSPQEIMNKRGNASALQAYLDNQPALEWHFNDGLLILGLDGNVIADSRPSAGRIGINFLEHGLISREFREGITTSGRPVVGNASKMPVFFMVTPIRDAQGGVTGTLVGVTNLSRPNFLDIITENRYGESGGYVLVSPRSRLIITASDKRRIMETLPAPGINPSIDAFIGGNERTVVRYDLQGVKVLASDKWIPAADWIASAILPTEEAYAPIRTLQQQLLLAVLLMTLLACSLTWWILRRQFSPLLAVARTLAAQSASAQPLKPLIIVRNDEVGQLAGSINLLLETLEKREAALIASDLRFRNILQDIPSVAIQGYGADGVTRYWNRASEKIYGYRAEEAIGRNLLDLIIPPEKRDAVQSVIAQMFETGQPIPAGQLSLMRKDGTRVNLFSSHIHVQIPGQAPEMFCVDIDLTKIKQLEDKLRQQEQHLRAVLDTFPFMVWVKDKNSRYLGINQAFVSVYGLSSTRSMNGKTDYYINPPDLSEQYRADDQAVLASGSSRHVEELIEIKGQRHWFETYKSPVKVDGNVIGVVGFARDITPRKNIEVALVAALDEAKNANAAKSRFLAAASHDLRQPLAALSLYVGVLKSEVAPDTIDLVNSIQDCVDSLSELLTDLLDVSKLDAGAIIPRPSDFTVNEMLAPLVSIHSAEAALKGLNLRWRNCNTVARTDQTLMRRLLGNLVNNAIRYTETGGVLIACRRHQGKRWVEVWDTGIGIPEDQTDLVFEEFRQLGDNARNRGSGLGLAIVAKTARLLGLQIRLNSRPGRGSMFAVELPTGRALVPTQAPSSGPVARPLRIALVEDNIKVLQALVLVFERAGNEVIAATNAQELIMHLGNSGPDIVISDYRLSAAETGFDVIEAVRNAFGDELPALLITGDTDPALIRSMADRGIAVHYKPLQIETLLSFIREATERRHHEIARPARG